MGSTKLTKNKVSYDAADAKVTALGIDNIYATSLDYETKLEHQANHGIGSREPRTYSMGKKSYSCNLEINMVDVVAIQNANKGKAMVDIAPFPVIVEFNPSAEGALAPRVTDILIVKFTNSGRKISEMDSKMAFEMFVLSIEENVA